MHINIISKGSLDFLSEYSINISNKILGTTVNTKTINNSDKFKVFKISLMLITYLTIKFISYKI